MKTLEQLRKEYSQTISLLEMEKIANDLLDKYAYSTTDLLSEFNVDNLHKLFNDSHTNNSSIIDVLDHATEYKLNQRARHVYSEAARVFKFQDLCAKIDGSIATVKQLWELGDLANSSQKSCRDLYECSSAELDELTNLCCKLGAFGSRLTGAGWGGSTVSFVLEEKVGSFISELKEKFYNEKAEHCKEEYVFACKPMCGASIYVKK